LRAEQAGDEEPVRDVVRNGDPDAGRLRAVAVRLKESRLASGGPTHETVDRLPLDG